MSVAWHNFDVIAREELTRGSVTVDEFRERYVRVLGGIPVIISGADPSRAGPIDGPVETVLRWTPEYLMSKYGTNQATWNEVESPKIKETKQGTLTNYMRALKQTPYYYAMIEFKKPKEWVLEPHFTENYVDLIPNPKDYCRIFLGNSGTVTAMHVDYVDTNIHQVKGLKRVVLFSPDAWDRLVARHNITYDDYFYYETDLSDEDVEGIESCGGQIVYLKPGDVMYLPAGWFHQITNLSDGMISLSDGALHMHNLRYFMARELSEANVQLDVNLLFAHIVVDLCNRVKQCVSSKMNANSKQLPWLHSEVAVARDCANCVTERERIYTVNGVPYTFNQLKNMLADATSQLSKSGSIAAATSLDIRASNPFATDRRTLCAYTHVLRQSGRPISPKHKQMAITSAIEDITSFVNTLTFKRDEHKTEAIAHVKRMALRGMRLIDLLYVSESVFVKMGMSAAIAAILYRGLQTLQETVYTNKQGVQVSRTLGVSLCDRMVHWPQWSGVGYYCTVPSVPHGFVSDELPDSLLKTTDPKKRTMGRMVKDGKASMAAKRTVASTTTATTTSATSATTGDAALLKRPALTTKSSRNGMITNPFYAPMNVISNGDNNVFASAQDNKRQRKESKDDDGLSVAVVVGDNHRDDTREVVMVKPRARESNSAHTISAKRLRTSTPDGHAVRRDDIDVVVIGSGMNDHSNGHSPQTTKAAAKGVRKLTSFAGHTVTKRSNVVKKDAVKDVPTTPSSTPSTSEMPLYNDYHRSVRKDTASLRALYRTVA